MLTNARFWRKADISKTAVWRGIEPGRINQVRSNQGIPKRHLMSKSGLPPKHEPGSGALPHAPSVGDRLYIARSSPIILNLAVPVLVTFILALAYIHYSPSVHWNNTTNNVAEKAIGAILLAKGKHP